MNELLASEFMKNIQGPQVQEARCSFYIVSRITIDMIYQFKTIEELDKDNICIGYITDNSDNINNDGISRMIITIPISIPDKMTGNSRKWKILFSAKNPIFVLTYNKNEIFKSEKFSEIYNKIIGMNERLRDKYLTSKKNAAQNKGDIRYIIATAIREEGLKRGVKFDSAVTGEDAYKVRFSQYIDTLYYSRQMIGIVVEFDTESNVLIHLGNKLEYTIPLADPNFDPNKLVTLVFHLVDDIVKTEEKSFEYHERHFNNIIQTWFKEKSVRW